MSEDDRLEALRNGICADGFLNQLELPETPAQEALQQFIASERKVFECYVVEALSALHNDDRHTKATRRLRIAKDERLRLLFAFKAFPDQGKIDAWRWLGKALRRRSADGLCSGGCA